MPGKRFDAKAAGVENIYRLLFYTREKDTINRLRAIIILSLTYLMGAGALFIAAIYYGNEFVREATNQDPAYLILAALFVCVVANILARYGRVEQAGLFLAIGMIPVIVFDDPAELVSTPSGAAFLLPIMIVGVANGPRAIIVIALVCEAIVIALASMYGWVEGTIDLITIPFLVAMIFALVVKTMDYALNQMREKIKLELDLREEQFRSAQAEERATFIGSIAHDIRGPIRAADELLQMYQEEDIATEERQEIINTVQHTLVDMHHTITNHLKQSKAIENSTTRIDIIEEINRIARNVTGIKIELIDEVEQKITNKINLKIFERAIQNIITNSKEAGATQVVMRLALVDTALRLTIADNGPGYPSRILLEGPEDGFTLKRGGLGIGLAGTVKNLASQNILVAFSNKHGSSGAVTTITVPLHYTELINQAA
jgi:signal transduction histidine kinase